MKHRIVILQCAYIMYLLVTQAVLYIHKSQM